MRRAGDRLLDVDVGVPGDFGVTLGVFDVSHYFHRCRLRCFQNCGDIREYLRWTPVTAGDLEVTEMFVCVSVILSV